MRKYLLEQEIEYSREERAAFLEAVKGYSALKNEIYRSKRLKEIAQNLESLCEQAEVFTLKETEDGWFDNVTISRDVKRIRESCKVFTKTAEEICQLQQRLESSFEDIGSGLSRYYDI
jgi:DNA-binding transcriptional regulator GbsR (MarR family)